MDSACQQNANETDLKSIKKNYKLQNEENFCLDYWMNRPGQTPEC
jgi:hypothetical protein